MEIHLHTHYSNLLSLEYLPVLHQMSKMLELVQESLSMDQEETLSRLADQATKFYGKPISATTGSIVTW